MPIFAIRHVGAGKSLYFGSDSAWRWRRGEDKYHYRFGVKSFDGWLMKILSGKEGIN